MLLTRDGSDDASDGRDDASTGDRFGCTALLDRVRSAFPRLAIGRCRVERSGGDHVLLVIDEEHVFRFPRDGMHGLQFEMAVLAALRGRTAVAVPAYDHVDPAGRFAGYRFIAGVSLTPARFAALGTAAQERLLDTAARFLAELHGLTPGDIAWPGEWPTSWTAAHYADRGLAEHLPLLAAHAPSLATPAERFYRDHRHDAPSGRVIVHGDLVAEHLLLDWQASRLSGIIDFGDLALGDAAQDLAGFWAYGADAVERLAASHSSTGTDPGLFRRSRNHFVRDRLDRLCDGLAQGDAADRDGPGRDGEIAVIARLLDAAGFPAG